MTAICSSKIESMAIREVQRLVDGIPFAKANLEENDKAISWDGNIELYHGNPDKKSNFDYSIRVQIKGRTTTNKKLSSKTTFKLDRIDMENYFKEHGTIFFLCKFLKDQPGKKKLYYASLLPFNLKHTLNQYNATTKRVKVDLREVGTSENLEQICRRFHADQEMQMRASGQVTDSVDLQLSGKIVRKIPICDLPTNLENAIGEERFVYAFDERNTPVNVAYGTITSLDRKISITVLDSTGLEYYSDAHLEITEKEKVVHFGNDAFSITYPSGKFNFNIKGSMDERIRQLRLLYDIFKTGRLTINADTLKITPPPKAKERCSSLLSLYTNTRKTLNNLGISKDIHLEKWNEEEFKKLLQWLKVLEGNRPVTLKYDTHIIGTLKIQDLRISISAQLQNDGRFDVKTIWSNESPSLRATFTFEDGHVVKSNNPYLVLDSEIYQSDDINFAKMKKYHAKHPFKERELELVNLQVLEALKAYDISQCNDLLDYAEFLTEYVKKSHEHAQAGKINHLQILARKNKLDEKAKLDLIEMRESSDDSRVKICCDILLGNKSEANLLLSQLNPETLGIFKTFPIMSLL